ncbi:MAG: septum formation initiator family protein [Chitinivibrionales bacterium]|nr:septum formation initiator family protein [Chitinivibrionales bacterium]
MKNPKKIGRWIVVPVVGSFLYFSITGSEGLLSLIKARRSIQTMNSEIQQYHHAIDSLHTTINLLKRDSTFIERIARERLGMAKHGEKVIKFVEE